MNRHKLTKTIKQKGKNRLKKGKLDEKDLKIINMLQKNARTPFSDIAKELGLSSVAVLTRFNKLEKAGIITGSIIQVDLAKFGFNYIADIIVEVNPSEIESCIEILEWINKEVDNRISYFTSIGKNNILMNVALKNTLELEKIIENLKTQNAILKIKIFKWTETGRILALPENMSLNYPVEG